MLNPRLQADADRLAARFGERDPFRHVVIGDFLAPEYCATRPDEFPPFGRGNRRNEAGRLGGRFIGTDFAFNPNFAKLAEACGCYGEKIEAPGDVEPALQRALAANEAGQPAVLDFLVLRARSPQTAKFFHIKDAEF